MPGRPKPTCAALPYLRDTAYTFFFIQPSFWQRLLEASPLRFAMTRCELRNKMSFCRIQPSNLLLDRRFWKSRKFACQIREFNSRSSLFCLRRTFVDRRSASSESAERSREREKRRRKQQQQASLIE